ncbi:helix-turn-helix domain-containing protein [Paenalcaligenes hominis]|uniref:helix-turn-helix domain-containing protein n=1 Tax=Paenalcaligenes hominis TaxID=643674 RepID=UPI0035248CAD
MKTLPCVTHVSHSNGKSFFDDFGLSPEEIQRAELWTKKRERLIELKQELIEALRSWIAANRFKQAEVATILGISRPRVSDLINNKFEKFSLDALTEYVLRTDRNITLTLG